MELCNIVIQYLLNEYKIINESYYTGCFPINRDYKNIDISIFNNYIV